MGKYIDFRYFLVSLAIGLLYIYISDDHRKVIILYPTPDNIQEYQYKDKTDTCFSYEFKEKECPSDSSKYHTILLQK